MENRLARIKRTSLLGVGVNVAIAALKIVVGLFASSVAIVSEGMNNAADALTSALTLIGVKLSEKQEEKQISTAISLRQLPSFATFWQISMNWVSEPVRHISRAIRQSSFVLQTKNTQG